MINCLDTQPLNKKLFNDKYVKHVTVIIDIDNFDFYIRKTFTFLINFSCMLASYYVVNNENDEKATLKCIKNGGLYNCTFIYHNNLAFEMSVSINNNQITKNTQLNMFVIPVLKRNYACAFNNTTNHVIDMHVLENTNFTSSLYNLNNDYVALNTQFIKRAKLI